MSRLVDLTLPFGPGTPSPPSVGLTVEMTTSYRGPGHWQASKVEMLLHTGSHVDFARHCEEGGETAADVELDRTIGGALVIDVTDVEPGAGITRETVAARAPTIAPGDIVLVRTDWSDQAWGEFPRYFLESPWCTDEAAEWIVEQGAKAVGFDCFSERSAKQADFTSEEFTIHKIVLEAGAILMQQLTNLSSLPVGERVQFFAAYPKMREAEGVPARYFALLD